MTAETTSRELRESSAREGGPPSETTALRRLIKNASGTAALQAISTGAGLLISLMLARLLGTEGYGNYAFSLAWASALAVIAVLGFDRFLVRYVAIYEVEGRWDAMHGLLRRAHQIVLLCSLGIAACGVTVAQLWLGPTLQVPFIVAMAVVPLTALTLVRQGAMQAMHRVVRGQLPEYLIRPSLVVIGIVALDLAGRNLLSAASAMTINVICVAVAWAVGGVLMVRVLPSAMRRAAPRYHTRAWLSGAAPMMAVAAVWMLNNYVGTIVTGTLRGGRAAGIFSVVQSTAGVTVLFLVAANMPLAPIAATLHARGEWMRLERTTERVASGCLLISVVTVAVIVAIPETILQMFGMQFASGAPALIILATAQLVNAASGPAGNVVIMAGYQRAAAKAVGLGTVVNLVLGILLVSAYGVMGAAMALATGVVVSSLALVMIARKRVGVNVTAVRGIRMRRG